MPLNSTGQPRQYGDPISRSPTVTLREESKGRDMLNSLKLRDQAHSSNQVHGIAAEPSKIPSSENLLDRDLEQSQRHNATAAMFRDQILHGKTDAVNSG